MKSSNFMYPEILQIMPVKEQWFAVYSANNTGDKEDIYTAEIVAWALVKRQQLYEDETIPTDYYTDVVGMVAGHPLDGFGDGLDLATDWIKGQPLCYTKDFNKEVQEQIREMFEEKKKTKKEV